MLLFEFLPLLFRLLQLLPQGFVVIVHLLHFFFKLLYHCLSIFVGAEQLAQSFFEGVSLLAFGARVALVGTEALLGVEERFHFLN